MTTVTSRTCLIWNRSRRHQNLKKMFSCSLQRTGQPFVIPRRPLTTTCPLENVLETPVLSQLWQPCDYKRAFVVPSPRGKLSRLNLVRPDTKVRFLIPLMTSYTMRILQLSKPLECTRLCKFCPLAHGTAPCNRIKGERSGFLLLLLSCGDNLPFECTG